jgi:acetyl-CoA carboxylase biotin carboxylase subunit
MAAHRSVTGLGTSVAEGSSRARRNLTREESVQTKKPIRRVLVANRGEIAVRIIRACRELGIETVQAYSEADSNSLAVQLADRSVCIGKARSSDSYLNPSFLVSAAIGCKVDAIHPGYGFLSENAAFATMCEEENLVFIGPRADVIRNMGDKAMARKLAKQAGVPTTPGSEGKVSGVEEAEAVAAEIGYPVILKASAGGGGRGMRIVSAPADLRSAFLDAAREAKGAFGDDAIYVEKYLTKIRHIEIQVIGDGTNVLHFGERDCSIQRRNQKLVEESPSPALSAELRARFGEAALRICRHVGYTSAGTIEFILDESSGNFYFMEMNTRIQVEHPVTEMVTGFDLVKCQLRIAAGESLGISQDQISMSGHAIECRINAEDFENDFRPCPGRITDFRAPGGPGVRVDSHIFSGYVVPPNYDSLLAKVICWGQTRDEALARMRGALKEMRIDGVKTTAAFHQLLLDDQQFRAGQFHTRYVQENLLA